MPEELQDLAFKLIQNHASNRAMLDMDLRPTKKCNEQKHQVIQMNCDLLQYTMLSDSISTGDNGIMEDMVPHLLL